MYQVKLYRNTGFNAINIPDSPSLLPEADAYLCPALDIYQARELSQFSIRISPGKYHEIQDADYLYLQNDQVASDFAYYSVQNITMTSNDVAVVSVTMDYILTAGGVRNNNLEFLDGICERHHVPKNDDIFGAFDESDPYLTPAEMLQIETDEPDFITPVSQSTGISVSDLKKNVILLESTVSLRGLWEQVDTPSLSPLAITYNNIDFSDKVSVPVPYPVKTDVYAHMYHPTGYWSTLLPKVALQSVNLVPASGDVSWVPDALSYIRALGLEDAVIAQYAVPRYMIANTVIDNLGKIQSLDGYNVRVSTNLPYIHNYTYQPNNKRVYYGDNCKYHIISIASGNAAEFLPEEIYESGFTSPTVEMRVDPRPKGAPYFRFKTYRGNDDAKLFFTNVIRGCQWQNVPLVYEQGSGSLLNQYKFTAQQAIAKEDLAHTTAMIDLAQKQNVINDMANVGGGALQALGYLAEGRFGEAIGSGVGMLESEINYQMSTMTNREASFHAQQSYALSTMGELQSLLVQKNVVAPSINFPISEGIRDYVGNTCLVYRTHYTENDVARIDKVLTMFGYKHTTPIENSLLTNRSKFNYILAKGVSIKNTNIPKWIRDGVAMQFASGVRIWHVAPDPACYTDGTNT